MEKNRFKIDVSLDLQKIFVQTLSDKYNGIEVIIVIKDIESKDEINRDTISLSNGLIYWYQTGEIKNHWGFIVEVYQNENKIFEESIRTLSIKGQIIKKQCLFIADLGGMGDTFQAEPLIRKINKIFEQKIIVFTYYPQIFINHPCIEKVIKVDLHHAMEETPKNVPQEYLNEDLYDIRYVMRWDRDRFGYIPHWTAMDLRQYAAFQYGITLKTDELDLHFYPDDFQNIDELPEKYVVINPSITGRDRTWDKEKWQKLVDILNEKGVNVVSLGKTTQTTNEAAIDTGFYSLDIKKGLDLCGDERQNTLSQAWYIINKADAFITMPSGLLNLASTTDTHIVQLGGNGDPSYFNMPYRNGIQGYKYIYVEGECKIKCISDPKYTMHSLGYFGNKNFKGDDRLGYCIKDYPEFKCHPNSEDVSNEILKILGLP
jgi:ADP-heptose:LPS heptosyltransferase